MNVFACDLFLIKKKMTMLLYNNTNEKTLDMVSNA